MIRATSLTGQDTKAGWRAPGGASTWVANFDVTVAGWNCKHPSRIQSHPSVTGIPRRVTRDPPRFITAGFAVPGPPRTGASTDPREVPRYTIRHWRLDP